MKIRIDLSRAQLETLEAAARDELTTDDHGAPWRLADGRPVTATAEVLLNRNLITARLVNHKGDVHALITDLGLAVLEEFDNRAPAPKQLTSHQRDILQAAADDKLDFFEPTGRWRLENGADATRAARQLRDRGLIRPAVEELTHNIRQAVVTADGYVALGALDPKPKREADHG